VATEFALIGNFINLTHFWEVAGYAYFGKIKKRSNSLINKILEWAPAHVNPMMILQKSLTGTKVKGYTVMCPLTARQMIMLDEEFVVQKVVDAVNKAEEQGAKIAVLTGFTSVVGNQGEAVSKRVGIPVTTGNSFTAAAAIRGVKRAAELMDLEMKNATVAVIGATGDIGSACTRVLAKEVSSVVLIARDRAKLENLAREINRTARAKARVEVDVTKGARDADIIITVASSVTTLLKPQDIKSGAIVCDVALPKNVAVEVSRERNDVLVFDGGMIELNQEAYFPSVTKGYMAGCVTEGMILAMEERFEPFSLGRGNITVDKVEEIDALGTKHGFRLHNLKIGNKTYTQDDIAAIKSNIQLHRMN
jgi:predicted amino acid dehydrogenase